MGSERESGRSKAILLLLLLSLSLLLGLNGTGINQFGLCKWRRFHFIFRVRFHSVWICPYIAFGDRYLSSLHVGFYRFVMRRCRDLNWCHTQTKPSKRTVEAQSENYPLHLLSLASLIWYYWWDIKYVALTGYIAKYLVWKCSWNLHKN